MLIKKTGYSILFTYEVLDKIYFSHTNMELLYRNKGGVQPFFKIMYEYLLNVQTYLFVLSYLNAYWYIC